MEAPTTESSPARTDEAPTALELIRRPLSPSRAKDYLQCPKLFWYKTIEGRRTLPTMATARGNLAHTALEHLFDHEPAERTAEVATAYIEPAWRVMTEPCVSKVGVDMASPEAAIRNSGALWLEDLEGDPVRAANLDRSAREHRNLAAAGSAEEQMLLSDATKAVQNYFTFANPQAVEAVGRELHVEAVVDDVALHGFIDRVDRHVSADGTERVAIIDYKTGKPPRPAYENDAFFAMEVYALVLTEQSGRRPDTLRLLYLSQTTRERGVLTRPVTERSLETTRVKIRRLHAEIVESATHDVWETRKQRLCDWCDFQSECPAWSHAPA